MPSDITYFNLDINPVFSGPRLFVQLLTTRQWNPFTMENDIKGGSTALCPPNGLMVLAEISLLKQVLSY